MMQEEPQKTETSKSPWGLKKLPSEFYSIHDPLNNAMSKRGTGTLNQWPRKSLLVIKGHIMEAGCEYLRCHLQEGLDQIEVTLSAPPYLSGIESGCGRTK